MSDQVKKPMHYQHPTGIECVEITQHLNANLANIFKYVFRYKFKRNPTQDLEKAMEYLRYEIDAINNDVSGTRFFTQPFKKDSLKQKIIKINDYEGLTTVKMFYRCFYKAITGENQAVDCLEKCLQSIEILHKSLLQNA